ncbi:NAD(P)H-dependent amine dehydrogenase family protein [Microbispora sp. CA-102843]|uniref:NAD(P)H-dependent amine dehydrogenase family protein n=1 Tax=Microbispora sp. CA-102843 TaxID=3239952 RepID=UPI003D93B7EA
MSRSYRVVQWATGAIGRVCGRHVIDRPGMELVGLLTYSDDKAGRDAGEILRRRPIGVTATKDIEDILALDADVVLHTPLNGESPGQHVDDLVRLLRSGKNVITTVAFTYPWPITPGNTGKAEPEHTASLRQAALEGGATLFGTGVNPGLITERLAVTATTMCTDVRHIHFREVYDCSPVISPGFIYELCGFGMTPERFKEATAGRAAFFTELFGEITGYVSHALNVEFVSVEEDHEIAVAKEDVHIVVGTIPKGTVSCARWRWHANTEAGRFLTIQMDWRADDDQPDFQGEDGWTITIDGAPKLKIQVGLDDPEGYPDRSKAMQYAVAGPVVQAIEEVCAAPPGILVLPTFAPWRPAPLPR